MVHAIYTLLIMMCILITVHSCGFLSLDVSCNPDKLEPYTSECTPGKLPLEGFKGEPFITSSSLCCVKMNDQYGCSKMDISDLPFKTTMLMNQKTIVRNIAELVEHQRKEILLIKEKEDEQSVEIRRILDSINGELGLKSEVQKIKSNTEFSVRDILQSFKKDMMSISEFSKVMQLQSTLIISGDSWEEKCINGINSLDNTLTRELVMNSLMIQNVRKTVSNTNADQVWLIEEILNILASLQQRSTNKKPNSNIYEKHVTHFLTWKENNRKYYLNKINTIIETNTYSKTINSDALTYYKFYANSKIGQSKHKRSILDSINTGIQTLAIPITLATGGVGLAAVLAASFIHSVAEKIIIEGIDEESASYGYALLWAESFTYIDNYVKTRLDFCKKIYDVDKDWKYINEFDTCFDYHSNLEKAWRVRTRILGPFSNKSPNQEDFTRAVEETEKEWVNDETQNYVKSIKMALTDFVKLYDTDEYNDLYFQCCLKTQCGGLKVLMNKDTVTIDKSKIDSSTLNQYIEGKGAKDITLGVIG